MITQDWASFDEARYAWLLRSGLQKFPQTENEPGKPDAADFVCQIEQAWAAWVGLA